MRNLILALVAAFLLVGCGTKPTLVKEEKHIVVQPPEGLWNCPEAPQPPPPGATQAEVADYILRLYQNQEVCKESMEEVRRYLEQAQKITEQVEQ